MNVKTYLIDIIELMPINVVWLIESNEAIVFELFKKSNISFKKTLEGNEILLNDNNKKSIIDLIHNEDIEDMIVHHTFKDSQGNLFKGYDYLEYGVLSKRLKPSSKHFQGLINQEYLSISDEW